jgi:hypothetical protein
LPFLTRTRLLRAASGTQANKTLIDPPTTFRTSAVGDVFETVPEAMAAVPAGSRPNANTWWQYVVVHEVGYAVQPTVRGIDARDPDRRTLVFDAAFWETLADQQANPTAPQRWNTFLHQFIPRAAQGAQALIRASMEDYLIRAHFANLPADGRDPRIPVTTDDPLGILARVADDDGVVRESPPRFRSASG